MQEKTLKKVWYGSIILYIGTLAFAFGYKLYTKDYHSVGMAFVAMLTPCIVPLIFKLCHWNVVYEIYILSNVFTYFASVWGGALNAYRLYGFDKALHFSSGWLITTAAVILYFTIKGDRKFQSKREFTIFLIFINAVNMAVAQLWEFYEYAMLIFFKNDCINHYTQGVHDSITDMLCAAVAGIGLTVFLVLYYKNGRRNFFVNIYEKFYDRNVGK